VATFSGDANNTGPVSSGCGDEPVTITVTPTLTTAPNPSSGNTPVTLNDSATLAGTSNLLATGTITFTLYGPNDPSCSGSQVIGSQTVNVTAGNNGPYSTTPGFTVTAGGTYQWTAHFSGDANNTAADSGCTKEPVVVTVPGQGCTPGFWKNHESVWSSNTNAEVIAVEAAINAAGAPYSFDSSISNFNNQLFFQIFGLLPSSGPFQGLSPSLTLIQALNLGGGGFIELARQATAGLLSSVSVDYPYSAKQVLVGVTAAFVVGNPNLVTTTFPDGVVTDLGNANNLSEAACPTT
jgi:hypothetical protein